MKIRFYCDVPEFHYEGAQYYAVTKFFTTCPTGYKRIAFDVDLPMRDLHVAEVVPAGPAVSPESESDGR